MICHYFSLNKSKVYGPMVYGYFYLLLVQTHHIALLPDSKVVLCGNVSFHDGLPLYLFNVVTYCTLTSYYMTIKVVILPTGEHPQDRI